MVGGELTLDKATRIVNDYHLKKGFWEVFLSCFCLHLVHKNAIIAVSEKQKGVGATNSYTTD